MELRTTFQIMPSPYKITYDDPVMFIGSCFSSYIGLKMSDGHMPVMINPSGTVYNPVSVVNTLDAILTQRTYTREDLILHRGTWHSFNHYSDFSGDDPGKVLEKINRNNEQAYNFLKEAGFLFITFGTARVYRYRETGSIVSNCHKLPAKEFDTELLTSRDIVILWTRLLDELRMRFPLLKVIFTVSPVRHWKDGAHGNQVSKSVLFLALEDLLKNPMSPRYFPAYELVMDDLRDYRFYDEDMIHLAPVAVSYIWDAFADCYLDSETRDTWAEVTKICRAKKHRFISDSSSARKEFAQRMLLKIENIQRARPHIDFSEEKEYFTDIAK